MSHNSTESPWPPKPPRGRPSPSWHPQTESFSTSDSTDYFALSIILNDEYSKQAAWNSVCSPQKAQRHTGLQPGCDEADISPGSGSHTGLQVTGPWNLPPEHECWRVAWVTKRKTDGVFLQGAQWSPTVTALVWEERGGVIHVRNQKGGKRSPYLSLFQAFSLYTSQASVELSFDSMSPDAGNLTTPDGLT